jgi:hypothetical protein
VNPRKEFFRTTIDEIVKVVKANHGEVEYTADAEALQYYESLNTDPDEQAVIEEAFEKATAGRMHGEYELDD